MEWAADHCGPGARPRPTPTIAELIDLDPRIGKLLADAGAVKDEPSSPGFCNNFVFYTRFKPRIVALVGFERPERHPALCTPTAYDVVYDAVDETLPDCRNCCCL